MSSEPSSVSFWLRQLKARETDAAQKLWERYFERLVRLARAKLGDLPRRVADEEDVALSAFNSFYQAATAGRFPRLDDRDDLWRLLVTITVRKVHQLRLHQGYQKRGSNAVLDEAALAEQSAPAGDRLTLEQFITHEPTPEFAAAAAEEFQRLLTVLPEEGLRLLAQWKMEGFTNQEIADRLGCSLRTVERQLRLIRACWASRVAGD
jgi:RNA polymerase sigma factor (sigma-70 family)